MKAKQFNILTIFPDMILNSLKEGLVGQAFKDNKACLSLINPVILLKTHIKPQTTAHMEVVMEWFAWENL